MPRPPSGPRRIDSSGTWYAVKTVKGKRRYVSLQTKLKSEAMRRWPTAQAELERLCNPPTFARGRLVPIATTDASGELVEALEWTDNLTRDEYLIDAANPTAMTWSKAQAIAEKRFKRRRGKEVSRSWRYNLSNALRHLAASNPLELTPTDIREMVQSMEEQGYKDSTIAIRASAIGGVIDSLIKGGYTPDDYTNPVDRIDTAAVSIHHHYKAKPEDYQLTKSSGPHSPVAATDLSLLPGIVPVPDPFTFYLNVIIFTGARINEALKGDYSEPGWLKISAAIAKNKASVREIPLPPFLLARRKLEDTMSDDCFRTHFNRLRPHDQLTPHSFRHGWKSAARMAGADEITAERLLGHAVGKMNSVYGVYPREVLIREAERVWQVIRCWSE